MALSPYINETVLTASIESAVPISAQGTLTQIVATSEYDTESGMYIYTVTATDGENEYQIGRKSAISASTCVGISFSGREGTATFDITPTSEGYTYKATSIANFYSSVNGEAELVNKVYGSAEADIVSGVTGEIRTGGIGNVTAFDATTFWASQGSRIDKNKVPLYLYIAADSTQGSRGIVLERVRYSDGTYRDLRTATMTTLVTVQAIFARDGITLGSMTDGSDYIDLTPVYSKEPQTKLVHQSFGHVDYTVYGTVTYYTNSARTETRTAPLLSQEEVNSLHGVSGASDAWSANIGNGTVTVSNENICGVILNERVTSIPARFLKGCTYLTSINISEARLTSIPDSFMIFCKNFNSSIVLPSTITSIGDSFLASNIGDDVVNTFNQDVIIPEGVTSIGDSFLSNNNAHFNSTITLPSTLTRIGFSFLYHCRAYNKNLVLPQSITSIGSSFLAGMRDMTSTVNVGNLSAAITPNINLSFPFSANDSSSAAYTTGIRIAGANRAEWLSKYTNSSSDPYRKLVDAGY